MLGISRNDLEVMVPPRQPQSQEAVIEDKPQSSEPAPATPQPTENDWTKVSEVAKEDKDPDIAITGAKCLSKLTNMRNRSLREMIGSETATASEAGRVGGRWAESAEWKNLAE